MARVEEHNSLTNLGRDQNGTPIAEDWEYASIIGILMYLANAIFILFCIYIYIYIYIYISFCTVWADTFKV